MTKYTTHSGASKLRTSEQEPSAALPVWICPDCGALKRNDNRWPADGLVWCLGPREEGHRDADGVRCVVLNDLLGLRLVGQQDLRGPKTGP